MHGTLYFTVMFKTGCCAPGRVKEGIWFACRHVECIYLRWPGCCKKTGSDRLCRIGYRSSAHTAVPAACPVQPAGARPHTVSGSRATRFELVSHWPASVPGFRVQSCTSSGMCTITWSNRRFLLNRQALRNRRAFGCCQRPCTRLIKGFLTSTCHSTGDLY